MKRIHWVLFGILPFVAGCSSYRQNLMFQTPEGFVSAATQQALTSEKNYLLQPGDLLQLDVYANNGEKAVDPSPELSKTEVGTSSQPAARPQYLLDPRGVVKLPMVGEIALTGLSVREAEEILQKEYGKFFEKPFVSITVANSRVIVLGAQGGQVIPLTNQPTRLVELLALAKGMPNDAKANNIRILRGTQVFVADFSTLAGFQAGNIILQPGDVVYVEPIRRPLTEGLRDNAIFITLLVSLGTLVFLIKNATK